MFNRSLSLNYSPEVQTISIPTRDKIDEKYKWNLKDIYISDTEWEKDFKWVKDNIINYRQFEGTLSASAEKLLACLKFDEDIGIKLERLYLYSMLAKDSDMRNPKYQGMDDRIKSIYSKVLAAGSFIKPELLK
ncbi:MAG: oligoendopeptidase F, partial [Ignavibacteria bacterium]|nr:oligoendopeptidase F [Ignavibacteria bacterium]